MKVIPGDEGARRVGRRELLKTLGMGLGAVPVAGLLAACRREAAPGDAARGETDGAATDGDETDSAATADAAGDGALVTGWATGGTAAMTAVADYPDPFAPGGSSCELLCQTTMGPCHAASPERRDVSDGWDGLPLRLALKLVDPACRPIDDAIVEIWHTNHRGTYSGDIHRMCNTTAAERAAQFFRGYQRSDRDGRVDFDSCFPGWYPGRAIHIHFRVMTGDYDAADGAAAVVVSQLFFSDELVSAVFSKEPLYSDAGQPDMHLANDGVIGAADDPSPYLCDVQRMRDGVMLASKTLVVRSSTANGNCSL